MTSMRSIKKLPCRPKVSKKRSTKPEKKEAAPEVSYHRKPSDMGIPEYQKALRKQFAGMQNFKIKAIETVSVFGDYQVHNPETGNSYKVALRSRNGEMNFCSCLDFKTNQLGTCKHFEAVITSIESNRKKKKLFIGNYTPEYVSIYLDYSGKKKVRIRYGLEMEPDFKLPNSKVGIHSAFAQSRF